MSEMETFRLEGARRVIDGWPESKALAEAIGAVEKAVEEGSDCVFDAAKALVESVCKSVLLERGEEFGANDSPQRLLKSALVSIGLDEEAGGDYVRIMTQNMLGAINALRDLRNAYGPMSHGKDAYHESLDDWQRTIAVRVAEAISVLVFESFQRLPVDDRHSRRPYDPSRSIHEAMDTALPIQVDPETNEISIGDSIRLRPSQLLYDYDRGAYVEARIETEDEEAETEEGAE